MDAFDLYRAARRVAAGRFVPADPPPPAEWVNCGPTADECVAMPDPQPVAGTARGTDDHR